MFSVLSRQNFKCVLGNTDGQVTILEMDVDEAIDIFLKADILQDFEHIKVCTAYRLGGNTIYDLPSCIEDLERVEPAYEVLPAWPSYDTRAVRGFTDLPIELRDYIQMIEGFLGVPVVLLSTGPGREETLVIRDPFNA